MLSDANIALFHKLLDSLTGNLRDLAVKYEVLVRQIDDRNRCMVEIESSVKDVKASLTSMTSQLHDVVVTAADGQSSLRSVSATLAEVEDHFKHIDEHLDTQSGDITGMLSLAEELRSLSSSIKTLREEVAPVIKLSRYISKPLAWVLVVYALVASAVAVSKVVDTVRDRMRTVEVVRAEIHHQEQQGIKGVTNEIRVVP